MVGCLRYGVGYEKLQERDDHVRSHSRPFKCPEHGCFYGEVGFANNRSLSQHISLCHTDLASPKSIFPALSNARLPTADERRKFRHAIQCRSVDRVQDLINSNSFLLDRVTQNGYTALQYAAIHGTVDCAQRFLHCGSSIGAVNKFGTALHVACSSRQTRMVKFLLLNSTCAEDVNAKDKQGNTPLSEVLASWCMFDSNARMEIFRLLLGDSRVFANTRNYSGRTPLSFAAVLDHSMPVPIVEMLLRHDTGIEIDTRDNEGRTPLSWAASAGITEVVKVFLQHSSDVNAKDARGRTPLSWAAGRQDAFHPEAISVVRTLLEHDGIDVDARDNEGRTPLSWAASSGASGVVAVFLQHGRWLDVNAKDAGGRTPLSWAATREFKEQPPSAQAQTRAQTQAQVRLQAHAQARARARAELEEVPVVKVLLKHDGIDVESRDDEGRTPLSWAASGGSFAVVDAFLGHGVGIDVNAKDNRGRTPLEWAAAREKPLEIAPVVQALVGRGGVGGTL